MEYYAFRTGFGHEGHGAPIFVAAAETLQICEEKAIAVLQDEFRGLWESKYRDTYIGTLGFVARSGHWTRRELGEVLDSLLESGVESME